MLQHRQVGLISLSHLKCCASWPRLHEQIRLSARLVDRVLKDGMPGNIPVEQPNRFELVVNRGRQKSRAGDPPFVASDGRPNHRVSHRINVVVGPSKDGLRSTPTLRKLRLRVPVTHVLGERLLSGVSSRGPQARFGSRTADHLVRNESFVNSHPARCGSNVRKTKVRRSVEAAAIEGPVIAEADILPAPPDDGV